MERLKNKNEINWRRHQWNKTCITLSPVFKIRSIDTGEKVSEVSTSREGNKFGNRFGLLKRIKLPSPRLRHLLTRSGARSARQMKSSTSSDFPPPPTRNVCRGPSGGWDPLPPEIRSVSAFWTAALLHGRSHLQSSRRKKKNKKFHKKFCNTQEQHGIHVMRNDIQRRTWNWNYRNRQNPPPRTGDLRNGRRRQPTMDPPESWQAGQGRISNPANSAKKISPSSLKGHKEWTSERKA